MIHKLLKRHKSTGPFVYVTFSESHHSFLAESVFKQEKIEGKLIAAPSFLTAGCGLAWRSPAEFKEQIEKIIDQHELKVEHVKIA